MPVIAKEKRGAEEIAATLNGQVVSWSNNYEGNEPSTSALPSPAAECKIGMFALAKDITDNRQHLLLEHYQSIHGRSEATQSL